MAARHADVVMDPAERLVDSRHRQPGIEWPLAVDRWLDERVQQARRAGLPRATRRELVAALMTANAYTDDELVQLIIRYSRMTTGELLGADDGQVLRFEQPRPGPRAISRDGT